MIVVDIEASGTNPEKHSIIAIGAIDTLDISRVFNEECQIFEGAHIDDEALEYNGFTIDDIKNQSKKTEEQIVNDFIQFAMKSDDHTLAGHSPAFDIGFLNSACRRAGINYPFAKRTIDLHSVCIAHLAQRGKEYPVLKNRSGLDSDAIMEYVGLPLEPKPHNSALNGALWEAEAFSRLMYGKNLLPQFEKYTIKF